MKKQQKSQNPNHMVKKLSNNEQRLILGGRGGAVTPIKPEEK